MGAASGIYEAFCTRTTADGMTVVVHRALSGVVRQRLRPRRSSGGRVDFFAQRFHLLAQGRKVFFQFDDTTFECSNIRFAYRLTTNNPCAFLAEG